MRKAALWVLGLMLLPVVGIAVFLTVAGNDFYRWVADKAVESVINRKVGIDGSFSVDPGWRPTIVVTDLWIANATWAEKPKLVRVKRLEVQIALKPLLSRIFHAPRLVVEGLTLDLETGPDGAGNWNILTPDHLFQPQFKFISLKDVSVTHNDRQSGRNTEVLLQSLRTDRLSEGSGFTIQGQGRFEQSAFRIKGRFGSLQDALAATAPYPLEVTLNSPLLTAELKGSARDFSQAEGFDMTLTAQAQSIGQVLKTLENELDLEGRAEVSARLKGDLGSLAVEDLVFDVVEQSGQKFQAAGSLADLWSGKGMDLQFAGKLGPGVVRALPDLPIELQDVVNGIVRLDIAGRMTGDFKAPAVENLDVQLQHRTGAAFSLQGHGSVDLSGGGRELTGLEATSVLSLPGPALLEQSLGTKLPRLGAIRATAELSGKEGWITLSSFKAQARSFGDSRLSAKGRIGKLLQEKFDLDPQLDLSASISNSRPLVSVFAKYFQYTLPPVKDPHDDLVLKVQQELNSLGLHPGAADGKMGPHTRTAIETYQTRHGMTVNGQATPELLYRLQQESDAARKPATGGDLILKVQRELNSLGLHPGAADGKMGPHTRAAIETYQTSHGLTSDGRATVELLRHLQKEPGFDHPQRTHKADRMRSRTANVRTALPELGTITASGRLSGRQGAYRLDDLRLAAGVKTAIWIEASGALETLRPEQENPIEGLDLKVAFGVPSSKPFLHLIPAEAPELRKITGHFDVKGSPEALLISKARFEVEGPGGLAGAATGQVDKLSFLPRFAMKGVDVELQAESHSTRSFARSLGYHLPELGALRAKAALGDRGGLFTMKGIDVSAGPPGKPAFHATGKIGNLLALKQVAMSGKFDVPTARLLGLDIPASKRSLGDIRGRFNLSDADGSVGLEKLSAKAMNTDLFSLSIDGLFDDLKKRDELKFQTSLRVRDPARLARQIGFDAGRLAALSFTGHISGSDERFVAEGKAEVGRTGFSGTLSGSIKGNRPVMSAKLVSPVFHFADFGLVPKERARKVAKKIEQRLFRDAAVPFDILTHFDLDLDVLVDQLEGVALDIDKARAKITLKDGVLKVEPLRFIFVGGSVAVHLVADARANDPRIGLRLEADDVDLGDLLAQIEVDVPLDGALDMVLNLKAVGASPRALTSSLGGKFDMAISRGHVRTSLLDLAAVDFIHWMGSDTARKGYSDLNCFIMRLNFHQGLGIIEKQLLDTTNVLALGTGDINLRNETIDIRFDPHAKKTRMIELTTPFSIEGPLEDPTVKTGSTTGRIIGEVVTTPIHLLGDVLLPFVHDRGKDSNNPCLIIRRGGPAG